MPCIAASSVVCLCTWLCSILPLFRALSVVPLPRVCVVFLYMADCLLSLPGVCVVNVMGDRSASRLVLGSALDCGARALGLWSLPHFRCMLSFYICFETRGWVAVACYNCSTVRTPMSYAHVRYLATSSYLLPSLRSSVVRHVPRETFVHARRSVPKLYKEWQSWRVARVYIPLNQTLGLAPQPSAAIVSRHPSHHFTPLHVRFMLASLTHHFTTLLKNFKLLKEHSHFPHHLVSSTLSHAIYILSSS